MHGTRKTLIRLQVVPVKSERTQELPQLTELVYTFADVSEVLVGVKLEATDGGLEGELVIPGYEAGFQANGVTPSSIFAKQFSKAKLVDVVYTGPRFQIESICYIDSHNRSTYEIPPHKLREVNKKLIRR